VFIELALCDCSLWHIAVNAPFIGSHVAFDPMSGWHVVLDWIGLDSGLVVWGTNLQFAKIGGLDCKNKKGPLCKTLDKKDLIAIDSKGKKKT
jgi:hypothetical protein